MNIQIDSRFTKHKFKYTLCFAHQGYTLYPYFFTCDLENPSEENLKLESQLLCFKKKKTNHVLAGPCVSKATHVVSVQKVIVAQCAACAPRCADCRAGALLFKVF